MCPHFFSHKSLHPYAHKIGDIWKGLWVFLHNKSYCRNNIMFFSFESPQNTVYLILIQLYMQYYQYQISQISWNTDYGKKCLRAVSKLHYEVIFFQLCDNFVHQAIKSLFPLPPFFFSPLVLCPPPLPLHLPPRVDIPSLSHSSFSSVWQKASPPHTPPSSPFTPPPPLSPLLLSIAGKNQNWGEYTVYQSPDVVIRIWPKIRKMLPSLVEICIYPDTFRRQSTITSRCEP